MLSNHFILCCPLLHSVFPSIRVMWPDAMILVFWMLSFKPAFSLSSYTVIKNIFSSSSLSAIRVVSSAYLRLLIFLLAIFIPACESSSLAFCMRHISFAFAYKLNKQGDNIQPCYTPFPILNQSIRTVDSWPAYRFLRRQVRCSGIPIFLRIFHSLLWSTQSKSVWIHSLQSPHSLIPWVRLQTAVLGVPAYDPRPQTDIIIGLWAKMQIWFYFNILQRCLFHLVSHRILLDLKGLARPSGAQKYQDPLPFSSKVPLD